jgi:hypothetical protein
MCVWNSVFQQIDFFYIKINIYIYIYIYIYKDCFVKNNFLKINNIFLIKIYFKK